MLFSLVLTLLGCSTPCDDAVGVMVAIGEMAEADKAKAVESCKTDYESKPGEKANVDALAACADKSGDEQKVCAQTAIVNRFAARAREKNDWGVVGSMCKTYGPSVTVCTELVKEGLAAQTKALTDIRDKGDDSISACVDLKGVAEAAGEEAMKAAETLCAEATAAGYAKEGMTEAKANIEAKKADIPLGCRMSMDKFAEVGTPWAQGKAKETAQVCFGDLGKVVLAAELPEMKYSCGYQVQQVYDAVKAHGITDPELDAMIAKADPLCAKKG